MLHAIVYSGGVIPGCVLSIGHWDAVNASKHLNRLTGFEIGDLLCWFNKLGDNYPTEVTDLCGKRRGREVIFESFVDFIILAKVGMTWDQLEGVCLSGVSERQLRNRVQGVGILLKDRWNLAVQPKVRFYHMEPGWPNVTAILDGTPAPTRLNGELYVTHGGNRSTSNYSGKYKFMCRKFEVWCTLQGCPIGFRGPLDGSRHDMAFFGPDDPLPFDHKEDELFLADLGYIGAAHMLTPYKSGEVAGGLAGWATYDELRDTWRTHSNDEVRLPTHRTIVKEDNLQEVPMGRDEFWNLVQPRLRSRVERMFSKLMEWKWFSHYDAHADIWAESAMRLTIFLTFQTNMRRKPYEYMFPTLPLPAHPAASACTCLGKGHPSDIERAKAGRGTLCDELWANWEWKPAKKPAKCARSEDRTMACRLQLRLKQYLLDVGLIDGAQDDVNEL